MKNKMLGYGCLLIGITLFSTIELCQKLMVSRCGGSMDPYMMVFARFFVTGVLLSCAGIVLFRRRGGQLGWLSLRSFLLNGLVGITLCLSLFHYGIDLFANASSAAVVFSANAIFVVILARFINGEAWSAGKWCAMLLGLSGISLFVFEKGVPDSETWKALGVMSLSALLFAFSVCYTKRTVSRYGAMLLMGGSSLVGGLLALPVFFLLSPRSFSEALEPMGTAWPYMVYFVLVATALAYWVYYIGLARTSAFHASMSFMLKPVLACILARLAYSTGVLSSERPMNVWTVTGAVLIVCSMLLAQLSARRQALAGQSGGK